MDSSSRWIAIAVVLGLCTAYALKGGPAAAKALSPVAPRNHPGQTAPQEPVAKSALKFKPETIDFGEVLVGQTLHKEVTVENRTGSPIAVSKVTVNCGCVKAEIPLDKIAPGQSAKLKVRFAGFAGKRPAVYTVRLFTDESGGAQAALSVAGKTKQVFTLEPQTLVFGNVPQDHPKTLSVIVKEADGKPFKIRTVAATHKEFSFKWEPLPDGGYKVLVTVLGPVTATAIMEQVGIITDHPIVPAVMLTVAARITREVISRTVLLTAPLGPDGRPGLFETVLERLTPGELTIENVTEGENAALEWHSQRLEDGCCKLTLRLKDVFERTLMGGEFLVQTNVEKKPLSVPFKVLRKKGF